MKTEKRWALLILVAVASGMRQRNMRLIDPRS